MVRQMKKSYDFIIVGAGTAGCVLANRLSENPNFSVLLIEGGRDDTREPQLLPSPDPNTNPWSILIRGGAAVHAHLHRTGFSDWQHTPTLRSKEDSGSFWYPRGSTWGGSSSVNFGVALRGGYHIYDGWARLGNTEWSYDKVLPYFKKIENRSQRDRYGQYYFDPAKPPGKIGSFDSKYHSNEGPLYYMVPNYEDPLSKALKTSAAALNIPVDIDFDCPNTDEGIAATTITAYDQFGPDFAKINPYPDAFHFPSTYQTVNLANIQGAIQRCSAHTAYLYPIQKRPNLTILSEALVTKIIFDNNKKAIGVEYLTGWNIYKTGRNMNVKDAGMGGSPKDAAKAAKQSKKVTSYKTVHANKEVILCGGVFNSPQLLMLSGIGPADHLQEMGIEVLHNSPGVGKHLVDHPEIDIVFKMKEPFNPFLYLENGLLHESIVLTMKFKSSPKKEFADFQVHIVNGGFSGGSASGITDLPDAMGNSRYLPPPQYIFSPSQTLPKPEDLLTHTSMIFEKIDEIKSEGYVQLKSKDPTEKLQIVTNLFIDEEELNTHVDAFKNVIKPFVENLGKLSETFFKEGGPTSNSPVSTISGGKGYFESWVIPKSSDFLTDAGEFDAKKYKSYVRTHVWAHHGAGTCKMGPASDPKAVV